jgi:protein-L-isoaspartate(D-aspartate) O-methyltransferase
VGTEPFEPEQDARSVSPGDFAAARARLLRQLEQRGIRSRTVLDALALVPRERFIDSALYDLAYADRALPIAYEQTISQPYIVALMTELSGAAPGARVLEVGTGCGYQTAVLAATGADVFSIEIVAPLAAQAAERLRELGVRAHLEVGDGHRGLPAHAPFDAILVTAAPRQVPVALIDQLVRGGRLIVPVGNTDEDQQLLLIRRTLTGEVVEHIAPVRFVPMTGG